MMRGQDEQSRILNELSALVFNLLRSPLSWDSSPVAGHTRHPSQFAFPGRGATAAMQQMTPAGFASFLLGMSLTLMLSGSVTLFIGFMLMPWVIGLLIVLYFVGIFSALSMLARAVLCSSFPPASPRKGFNSWNFMGR